MLTKEYICVIIATYCRYYMKTKNYFIYICLLNCILALITGMLIYSLFGKGTYIDSIIKLPDINIPHVLSELLRFYLADALWAYALTFSLSLFINEFFAGILSSVLGVSWELCQMLSIVSGTFDIIDILMYLSASALAVLIIHLFKRRHSL